MYTGQNKSQQGLTLTELMVAVTIGLIVTAAVAGLFLQTKSSYTQNDEIGYLQENGRYALKVLAEDLAMVDYFAGILIPTTIDVTTDTTNLGASSNGCGTSAGWNYNFTQTLDYLSQTTQSTAVTKFSCLSAAALDAGTDVLMIKRVKGQSFTDKNDLADNTPYLRSNKTTAALFKSVSGTTADPSSDQSDWQYLLHIYYIENHNLMRASLEAGSPPSVVVPASTSPLAEGIEQFHVVYGIDSTGDGAVDYYTSSPDTTEVTEAVLAKIYVLVRSSKEITGYKNSKAFQLGDLAIPAKSVSNQDGYYRRVFSTSVQLRNPQAIILLNNS